MTEPLPTDALRRLEALIKDLTGFNSDGSLSIDSETFMAVYIEYCTRQALLPWVAVPCGEEVVLVRIERRTPTMGSPWSVPYWYCEGAESMGRVVNTAMDYTGATRFPDPLTALESIKKP